MEKEEVYKQLESLRDSLEKWIDPQDPCEFDRDVQALDWVLAHLVPFVGEKLRNARRTNGLTQQELADLLECDVQQIRKWERGSCNPRPKTQKKLKEILGIRMEVENA